MTTAQAKLLRVLEDGEIRPVGGISDRKVDVRVVAATNVDLESRIGAGDFRQDLYFRLARFTVNIPPIRERKGDIPLLARHYLQMFAAEMGREAPQLGSEILQELSTYSFPGNVRELKNILERALRGRPGPTSRHMRRSKICCPRRATKTWLHTSAIPGRMGTSRCT